MLVIDVLVPTKTVHCSLDSIPHNESSNAGNIIVLENIFQQQYHLPHSEFEQHLFLVFSDQKITQWIYTIKHHREQAQQSYDCLQWVLPMLVLFHL